MNAELVTLSSVSLALVPVVIALTQAVKVWVLDSRYSSLVSIGFGILGALLVSTTALPITVLQGVLIGLTASGLFTGSRSLFQ